VIHVASQSDASARHYLPTAALPPDRRRGRFRASGRVRRATV